MEASSLRAMSCSLLTPNSFPSAISVSPMSQLQPIRLPAQKQLQEGTRGTDALLSSTASPLISRAQRNKKALLFFSVPDLSP